MAKSSSVVVVKRSGFVLGAIAVVLVSGTFLQTVLRIDPFAKLKKTSKDIDPNLGVRLDGVAIDSYEGDKLVLKANLNRMDVRQDRQHYDVFGVRNGVFYSKKGTLEFDSPRGQWNVPAHELDAPSARVRNKDVDLQVPQFAFRSDKGIINVPGRVQGKAFGGDIAAAGVRYNVQDGSFRAGPAEWNGKLALTFQEGEQASSRAWTIKTQGESYTKGPDVMVYEKGYGSDGDIIVMADLIEHNRKTDIVTATGNVKYFSSKTNMICEKAVIDRKIKKAILTGNVQMLLKAKEKQDTISADDGIPPYRPLVPDEIAKNRPQADQHGQTDEQKKLDDELRSGKNMRDYPTICYAEQIVYWYKKGERHADITGNPQARQEFPDGRWRQVWTNVAHYNGETERLRAESSAGTKDTRIINSLGDDLKAAWFDVSTKDGDEDYRAAQLEGTVMDYSDEIPREDKPLPKITPPRTGGQKTPPPGKGGSGLSGKIGQAKKKG